MAPQLGVSQNARALRARVAELGITVPRLLVESVMEDREISSERRATIAQLFETRRLLATVAKKGVARSVATPYWWPVGWLVGFCCPPPFFIRP